MILMHLNFGKLWKNLKVEKYLLVQLKVLGELGLKFQIG